MPGPLGPRVRGEYTSDDGLTYTVSLLEWHQLAGGFDLTDDIPDYPRGWKMRGVYGEAPDGERIWQPIADPSNSLFVDGGSFVAFGNSYTVRGRMGEKRPS
jgi:hypothetical protein